MADEMSSTPPGVSSRTAGSAARPEEGEPEKNVAGGENEEGAARSSPSPIATI